MISHSVGTMFYLSLIEHNLPVPPHLLNRPLLDAVKEELERLFLDKVGLVIVLLILCTSLPYMYVYIWCLQGYLKFGALHLCL